MSDGPGSPSPSQWDASSQPPAQPVSTAPIKAVGITLVVYNALSIVSGIFGVLMLKVVQQMMEEMAKKDPNVKPVAELYQQPWIGASNWVGLVLSILALIGSINLLRGRNYGLALTGAIVTMVNPGGACCCFIGTAFGIWALVVMLKPEVQAIFNRPQQ